MSLELVGCGHVRATSSQPSPVVVTASSSTTSAGVTTTSSTGDPGAAGWAAAEAEADGRFSLVVFDRTTGQVVTSDNATARYPAESVVKLLIAVDALQNGADENEISSMLVRSDDHIANQLWTRYGDVAIIRRSIQLMGLPNVPPPRIRAGGATP
ncbi:hypothetical protein ACFFS4_11235 [Kutzneria kofuensis]|uniref:Serine hydrolase n=1 Tax=Kutzneria kofuensis TaxID=103725 RepID=A0A7W9KRV7_9PSEU|nr:hypothetical protein [Kutzneria kofuensis]MBB5897566.1 hypothetical protein [Kutzneria kofuensis]